MESDLIKPGQIVYLEIDGSKYLTTVKMVRFDKTGEKVKEVYFVHGIKGAAFSRKDLHTCNFE